MKKVTKELGRWYWMTAGEVRLVAAILALLVLGMAARYRHMRDERPEPYQPAGLTLAGESSHAE